MPKISKRLASLAGKIEDRAYPPLEAIALVKDNANAKFDETMEAHVRLGIDPKYTDQQLRTTVALPNGTGQSVRIAVVTRGEKVAEAKAAGAELAGEEELVETISKGEMDFDLLIATPDMMPKVAKLGRVLGPRGLMPNPKAGTVTTDLEAAIKEFKAGKLEFRADRTGIVHVRFGKASFSPDALLENLKTLQETIDRNKPSGAKGRYWKSLYVTSTMGPSVEVDFSALQTLNRGADQALLYTQPLAKAKSGTRPARDSRMSLGMTSVIPIDVIPAEADATRFCPIRGWIGTRPRLRSEDSIGRVPSLFL